MSLWFKFGQTLHIQVAADPQKAGCGTRPLKPQPVEEFDGPPQFACRRCLLAWMEDVVVEEELSDALGRGYEASPEADLPG